MGVEQSLLDKVDVLRFKYEALNELENKNFNVFSVLFKETDETRLHSKFIAELLNPRGQHGKGARFLQLFLGHVFDDGPPVAIDECCEVSTERFRIDILIRCGRAAVILENKINARDQDRQLERYYEAVRDRLDVPEDKIWVVYLTPHGHKPSDQSVGALDGERVKCVSYRSEVLGWLKDCIKESAQNPALRESLIQYHRVVERITGNVLAEGYMNELKALLLQDGKYLQAASHLAEALPKARRDLELRFWEALRQELQSRLSLNVKEDNYRERAAEFNRRPYYGIIISLAPYDPIINCDYAFEIQRDGSIVQGFCYDHDVGYAEEKIDQMCDVVAPIDVRFWSDDWWFGAKCQDPGDSSRS